MNTKLNDFSPDDFVPAKFETIAETILRGGFRITSHDKKVYVIPTCIEFYYHDEAATQRIPLEAIIGANDTEYATCDPIVYHRNVKSHPKRPLFPLGTLNNHVSGIDITFERGGSPSTAIRASVLIREFKICGGTEQILNVLEYKENNLGSEERSTYLYGALFSQFSIFDGFEIKWVDNIVNDVKTEAFPRKNVFQYKKTGEMKFEKSKGKQDMREWQFKNTAKNIGIRH